MRLPHHDTFGGLSEQGQRCRLLWGKPQQDRAPAVKPNTAMLPSQVQLQREPAPAGGTARDAAPPAGGTPAVRPAPPQQQAPPPNFFSLPPAGMYGAAAGPAALYPSMDPQALGTRGAQFGIKRPASDNDGEHLPYSFLPAVTQRAVVNCQDPLCGGVCTYGQ